MHIYCCYWFLFHMSHQSQVWNKSVYVPNSRQENWIIYIWFLEAKCEPHVKSKTRILNTANSEMILKRFSLGTVIISVAYTLQWVLARPVVGMAAKPGSSEGRKKWNFWEKQLAIVFLDHKRNGLMTKELKTTPRIELTTVKQKSAAACKSNGTLQTSKADVFVRPQKKTVKRETSKEKAGDRNRPLGRLLERMMMTVVKR